MQKNSRPKPAHGRRHRFPNRQFASSILLSAAWIGSTTVSGYGVTPIEEQAALN